MTDAIPDITAETDSKNTEQAPMRLEQWHWLFGKRIFTLDAEQHLIVEERSLLRRCRTTLPLAMLHPAPTYASSFSLLWLVNTLFMGAVSIMLFHWSNVYAIPGLPLLGILFAVFALFTAYRFAVFTTQLTIFRHRHSNEHLVYLWRKRPDNERFNHFIAAMRNAIDKA